MSTNIRSLTALPVYNEARHVGPVLDEVLRYSQDVLVVDDGSTDGTSELLSQRRDLHVIRHPRNRGYGAALESAFNFALYDDYDVLVTIDCDGQHQPRLIPELSPPATALKSFRAADTSSSSPAIAGRRKRAAKLTSKSPPNSIAGWA